MHLASFLDVKDYPWIATLLAAIAAVVLAFGVCRILFAILRRLAKFSVMANTIVEATVTPARVVLPLLALQLVLDAAPQDLAFRTPVSDTLSILLICALTWLAARAVWGVGSAVIVLHPATKANDVHARSVQTQTRVLTRTVIAFVLLIGGASALMTLPSMRQIGASLLASAGVAGLVAGIAARPVLGNLIAGLQIALSQPLRLDDVVIIEGEWGNIEEITSMYVVVKIWDSRRLVVPLQWVIENPFQNWTLTGTDLLGTVLLWVDYRVPLAPLRAELERVCNGSPLWDRRACSLQVVDANERAMQIRALMSAADSSKLWDLRCLVREALIDFLQREHPDALPRQRTEFSGGTIVPIPVNAAAVLQPSSPGHPASAPDPAQGGLT